jgi:hypothetical protein
MFGISITGLLIIGFVVIFGVGAAFLKKSGGFAGPTLVLRKFKINESPIDNVLIEIVGRPEGIIGWLLTTLGLDAETALKVTDTEISFKSSSLQGELHRVVSLQSVSSTHCGYSKPILFMIIGVIVIIGGILGGIAESSVSIFFVGLILGMVFVNLYWLKKAIILTLETSGGMVLGLAFSRSVIENVSIDMEQALNAIRTINKYVVKSQISHVGKSST